MKSVVLITLLAMSCQVFGLPDICTPTESGSKAYPEDCSKFYICNSGYANLLQCPNDLYFDGSACNYQENVKDCIGGTRSPPSGPAPTEAPGPVDPEPVDPVDPEPVDPVDPEPVDPVDPEPVDPVDPGTGECPAGVAYYYLPYPLDCNRFYICQNGVVNGDSNCSPGLVFKPSEQACVVPTGTSCPN